MSPEIEQTIDRIENGLAEFTSPGDMLQPSPTDTSAELARNIGTTHFAMKLELHKDKKLAKEDTALVMDNLQQKGFHLQMPTDTPISEILEKIALNEQNKF